MSQGALRIRDGGVTVRWSCWRLLEILYATQQVVKVVVEVTLRTSLISNTNLGRIQMFVLRKIVSWKTTPAIWLNERWGRPHDVFIHGKFACDIWKLVAASHSRQWVIVSCILLRLSIDVKGILRDIVTVNAILAHMLLILNLYLLHDLLVIPFQRATLGP